MIQYAVVDQVLNDIGAIEIRKLATCLGRAMGLYQGANKFWQNHLKTLGVKNSND